MPNPTCQSISPNNYGQPVESGKVDFMRHEMYPNVRSVGTIFSLPGMFRYLHKSLPSDACRSISSFRNEREKELALRLFVSSFKTCSSRKLDGTERMLKVVLLVLRR